MLLGLAAPGRDLIWQGWDDVYLVFQPLSAETHVFNETTALILKCLEQGPLSTEGVKNWTEAALGVDQGELAAENFAFAVGRLEELGLIERFDEATAAQCLSVT
jgi:PqqD family protein of HPr-rel-A system